MKKYLDNIEAIEILKQIKDILLHNNSWLESTHNPITESFNIAIKKLEEEKENFMIEKEKYDFYIAPCGCGGEAVLYTDSCQYLVACTKCAIETPYTEKKEEAVEIWNNAMSSRKVNNKRTASVQDQGHPCGVFGYCSNCGNYCVNEDPYCSQCGAKLEWKYR